MKRKRNLYHLWFCFAMLLFLAVPFKVKAETATTPVSISVQYGQTEARTILNMINEMRTSSRRSVQSIWICAKRGTDEWNFAGQLQNGGK